GRSARPIRAGADHRARGPSRRRAPPPRRTQQPRLRQGQARPHTTPSEALASRERHRYRRMTEGAKTYGSDIASYGKLREVRGESPWDTAIEAVIRYRSHVDRVSRT